MIFRNLDLNHDWEFGKGKQDFLTQNRAIGLNVKTRLYSWLGDCFFDLDAGIDWWNRLGSREQRELLELDMRRIILQSEDVRGINDFRTSLIDREFFAEFDIITIYSPSYIDSLTMEI